MIGLWSIGVVASDVGAFSFCSRFSSLSCSTPIPPHFFSKYSVITFNLPCPRYLNLSEHHP